jgi:hypothetical protein
MTSTKPVIPIPLDWEARQSPASISGQSFTALLEVMQMAPSW